MRFGQRIAYEMWLSPFRLGTSAGPAGRNLRRRGGQMRRISEHVYAEIYFWGCNPGFLVTDDGVLMIDTPQQPIDAVRWRERLLEHGPIRHIVNTEPHADHIFGNSYFPGVEVIGQRGMEARYLDTIPRMQGVERVETMKET